MFVAVTYGSKKHYGPQHDSQNYHLTVSADDNRLKLNFRYKKPLHGKSSDRFSNAAVTSIVMALGKDEAFKIATMIIDQASNPTFNSDSSSWTPPVALPALRKRQWSKRLTAECYGYDDRIFVRNGTKLHIGKVVLDLELRTSHGTKSLVGHKVLVDLAPGAEKMVALDKSLPHYRSPRGILDVEKVEITAATGAKPSDLRR